MGEGLFDTTSCICNITKVITVLKPAQVCLSQRLSSGPALAVESIDNLSPTGRWYAVADHFELSWFQYFPSPLTLSQWAMIILDAFAWWRVSRHIRSFKKNKTQAFTVVKNKMYKIQMSRKINSFVACLGRDKLYAALHLKTQISFKVCSISSNDVRNLSAHSGTFLLCLG